MTLCRGSSVAFLIGLSIALPAVAAAEILKREPGMGLLKPGQRVLVDDGKCPIGQVREVIGGDHIKVGGKSTIERTWRCVPRR